MLGKRYSIIAPALLGCIALLVPSGLSGQAVFPEMNGASLTGIAAVDAIAISVTWLDMDRDRSNFDQNLQATFELGLRRDGVRVEKNAPNYLFCEIKVAQSDGLTAYSWDLNYYEYVSDGVYPLLWSTGGIVTVGSSNFDAEAAVEECVDGFASEWLKWNPRQPYSPGSGISTCRSRARASSMIPWSSSLRFDVKPDNLGTSKRITS